jgi:hypothetical protein
MMLQMALRRSAAMRTFASAKRIGERESAKDGGRESRDGVNSGQGLRRMQLLLQGA